MRNRYRGLRRRANQWLHGHPRVRRALEVTGCLGSGPETAARGVAVGLFVCLTPTVGLQTALLVIGCMLARGNFAIAFAVSWISNPFTVGPLYWTFHALGEGLFGLLSIPVEGSAAWYLQGPGDEMAFTAVGSLLVAVPVAVAGYFVSHRVSAAIARRLRARRRPSSAVGPGNC